MLRVSIHSGLPSEASRFNRTDWIDIGYQTLNAQAEYKIVLIENGRGAREPVYLKSYPRWSSSLWDLAARTLALSLWTARPAQTVRAVTPPSAWAKRSISARHTARFLSSCNVRRPRRRRPLSRPDWSKDT